MGSQSLDAQERSRVKGAAIKIVAFLVLSSQARDAVCLLWEPEQSLLNISEWLVGEL